MNSCTNSRFLLSQLFHYSAFESSSSYKDCLNYAYVFFEHLLITEISEMSDESRFFPTKIYICNRIHFLMNFPIVLPQHPLNTGKGSLDNI